MDGLVLRNGRLVQGNGALCLDRDCLGNFVDGDFFGIGRCCRAIDSRCYRSFFGGLVHKVMVSEGFSWWAIGILGGLMVLDRVVDLFATALGTKWFGGTTWGMIGALVGGVVCLFLGIVGILIGPIIGAVVFELIWSKRHPRDAAKSGVGVGLGLGLSAAGRLVVYFMMLGTLIVDYSMDDEVEPVEEPIEIVGEVV